MVTACPMELEKIGANSHMNNILNYKKPGFWLIVVSLLISAVATVLLLTVHPRPKQTDISRVYAMESLYYDNSVFSFVMKPETAPLFYISPDLFLFQKQRTETEWIQTGTLSKVSLTNSDFLTLFPKNDLETAKKLQKDNFCAYSVISDSDESTIPLYILVQPDNSMYCVYCSRTENDSFVARWVFSMAESRGFGLQLRYDRFYDGIVTAVQTDSITVLNNTDQKETQIPLSLVANGSYVYLIRGDRVRVFGDSSVKALICKYQSDRQLVYGNYTGMEIMDKVSSIAADYDPSDPEACINVHKTVFETLVQNGNPSVARLFSAFTDFAEGLKWVAARICSEITGVGTNDAYWSDASEWYALYTERASSSSEFLLLTNTHSTFVELDTQAYNAFYQRAANRDKQIMSIFRSLPLIVIQNEIQLAELLSEPSVDFTASRGSFPAFSDTARSFDSEYFEKYTLYVVICTIDEDISVAYSLKNMRFTDNSVRLTFDVKPPSFGEYYSGNTCGQIITISVPKTMNEKVTDYNCLI